ncbi:MAG TPA: cytochrome c biogenesis protein ResB [Holophagaceae bacterium]|nr:cytochrome c biogenesis protein ResB [Holophagaceae bacterium]
MTSRLDRFLTSPKLILGEVAAIGLLGSLGAILPQAGLAPGAEVQAFRQAHPALVRWIQPLGLDHLFRTPLFLALLVLATASLALVVRRQYRRLAGTWGTELTQEAFRTAPFQVSFLRPPGGPLPAAPLRTTGRWGAAGSFAFHLGLLLVILAGCARALWGTEAVVDLIEGESLAPTVKAWGAQWPGPFGRPFTLKESLTVEEVRPLRFPSGDLQDLRLQVRYAGASLPLGINEHVATPEGRLFVGSRFGTAALLEWIPSGGKPLGRALLMESTGSEFEGSLLTLEGTSIHARTGLSATGGHPGQAELRVVADGTLRAVGRVPLGGELPVPGMGTLRLHGLPFWVRLQGDRDVALPLAYLGFLLVILGGTLTYAVVRVDELVSVTPEGSQERVHIGMRPHRFAPLYRDRFERLVRHHGGTP